jgi:signal transduction histidine kinase
MRLSHKLTLSLLPAVVLVLGAFAFIRIDREVVLFEQDTRRDHRIVATTLAVVAGTLWNSGGEATVVDVIRQADATRSGVSIRWVSTSSQASVDLQPVMGLAKLSRLQPKEPLQEVIQTPPTTDMWPADEDLLLTYAAASVGGKVVGAVEVAESLSPRTAYLEDTIRNTLLLTLSLALASALVIFAVGRTLIARPVDALIRFARSMGNGESTTTTTVAQRDELGDLGRALEAAARQLETARERAHLEEEAKLKTLEQLRHAERLATTGKLASALAHEIGTPLNVVSGHAQLIAKGHLAADQVSEGARTIKGQCDRIAKLVRELLDYARRRPPRISMVNLADVARMTTDLLGPLATRRNVRLAFAGSEPAKVEADGFQSQQVVTNVVMNAIQATPAGGDVTVRVCQTERSHGWDKTNASLGMWGVVSVEDTGQGIVPENLEQVFEPFFTTKSSGEGTGLGLSIACDILREHGGFIEVHSEPGRGARFELHWPCNPEGPTAGVAS